MKQSCEQNKNLKKLSYFILKNGIVFTTEFTTKKREAISQHLDNPNLLQWMWNQDNHHTRLHHRPLPQYRRKDVKCIAVTTRAVKKNTRKVHT